MYNSTVTATKPTRFILYIMLIKIENKHTQKMKNYSNDL